MNADTVRSYCNAWMSRDAATIAACYHPDLTLHWPGRHRLAGTHEGRVDALAALLELQTLTARVPIEIVDLLDGDRSVVAIVRERWRNERESMETRRALEFTVADGQLRTCRIYETDQAAIDEWIGTATAP